MQIERELILVVLQDFKLNKFLTFDRPINYSPSLIINDQMIIACLVNAASRLSSLSYDLSTDSFQLYFQ